MGSVLLVIKIFQIVLHVILLFALTNKYIYKGKFLSAKIISKDFVLIPVLRVTIKNKIVANE